ncbi:MAG TPA: tail fiber protein [Steroidobacteraceae bacterium]|nr:tail fiber protein [Steroidobacteraceae bacterium]
MVTPYLGEVRMFGFGFAPKNWAACNGQTMSINQSQALFALLGTMYGGNGVSTFLLPNLQSSVPVHRGTGGGGTYQQGQTGGAESVTLNTNTVPTHFHSLVGTTTTGNKEVPTSTLGASPSANSYYSPPTNLTALNPSSISLAGGGQAHTNIQPYLVVNYCIALQGIFPSRN